MIRIQHMKKLIAIVNTFLMSYMILMSAFYARFGVTFMVYLSIPIAASHIVFYRLIQKEKLALYVKLLYAAILIYMFAATVCLGYNAGFHLYCWSLVAVAFYLDYLAHIMKTEKIFAFDMSVRVVIAYLLCTWYSHWRDPIYVLDSKVITTCLYLNALAVFCFIIYYSSFIHKLIIESEDKMANMALYDQLTELFNRRSMLEHLNKIFASVTPMHWIAMVDIDDFKKFNDTYGHSCGDYVLVELANIMRNVCAGSALCRWGGEEFLICTDGVSLDTSILELFRQAVERRKFTYEGIQLKLTITIGVANYEPGQSLDKWIQHADDNLYEGKRTGKNKIVY